VAQVLPAATQALVLASAEASYLTGATLDVNGGTSRRLGCVALVGRRYGESGHERLECAEPDPFRHGWFHAAAQLHRRESLAQRVKGTGGLLDRPRSRQTSLLEPANARDDAAERGRGGSTGAARELRQGQRALHRDAEQPRMLDRKPTKDRHARLDQIRNRVIGGWELGNAGAERVKCPDSQGHQQALLGVIDAVDGARGGADARGDRACRQRGRATFVQDGFGRIQKRNGGLPRHAAAAEAGYVRLLHEAGFDHVGSVLRVMGGGLATWLAR
jgi:hypothetical protein